MIFYRCESIFHLLYFLLSFVFSLNLAAIYFIKCPIPEKIINNPITLGAQNLQIVQTNTLL